MREALAGRYAIDREIGRGGLAVVYLADDLKHDRQVAIKVLSSELAAALGHERPDASLTWRPRTDREVKTCFMRSRSAV